MDFKGKRIDDELLLLPVPLGVGEVRIVDFPRQLRHLRAAVMHTVFQIVWKFSCGQRTTASYIHAAAYR